jgi:hypothetical protein
MSEKNRKILSGAQKAKIALEAVKEHKTMNEIAHEYGVHPTQIGFHSLSMLRPARFIPPSLRMTVFAPHCAACRRLNRTAASGGGSYYPGAHRLQETDAPRHAAAAFIAPCPAASSPDREFLQQHREA